MYEKCNKLFEIFHNIPRIWRIFSIYKCEKWVMLIFCVLLWPQIKLRHLKRVVIDIKILESSLVAQWIKDLAFSLLWLRWLQWCGFDPWPGNFHSQRWGGAKKSIKILSPCKKIISENSLSLIIRNLSRCSSKDHTNRGVPIVTQQ